MLEIYQQLVGILTKIGRKLTPNRLKLEPKSIKNVQNYPQICPNLSQNRAQIDPKVPREFQKTVLLGIIGHFEAILGLGGTPSGPF
jgi:hypothetical protein